MNRFHFTVTSTPSLYANTCRSLLKGHEINAPDASMKHHRVDAVVFGVSSSAVEAYVRDNIKSAKIPRNIMCIGLDNIDFFLSSQGYDFDGHVIFMSDVVHLRDVLITQYARAVAHIAHNVEQTAYEVKPRSLHVLFPSHECSSILFTALYEIWKNVMHERYGFHFDGETNKYSRAEDQNRINEYAAKNNLVEIDWQDKPSTKVVRLAPPHVLDPHKAMAAYVDSSVEFDNHLHPVRMGSNFWFVDPSAVLSLAQEISWIPQVGEYHDDQKPPRRIVCINDAIARKMFDYCVYPQVVERQGCATAQSEAIGTKRVVSMDAISIA